MSEPVGNAPRDPSDMPGNSHKSRQASQKAEPAPETAVEPATKMVEGVVVTRKQPWYKRFARNMVADDAQSIGDWVLQEVIVPSVKNLISDMVKGTTDRALYGTSRARRREVGDRGSLRTRYDRMSDEPEPRRMLSREDRARHNFDQVVLESRSEADRVIDQMISRARKFNVVTVSDLYDFVGVTGSYADRNHGWTAERLERYADVRQVRGGFLLDLPETEPIR